MNKINITPRQRQMRFRKNIREFIGWGMMMSIPLLMILDWIVRGY